MNYPAYNPYANGMYGGNMGYPQPYMGAQNMGQMPAPVQVPSVPVANNVSAQPVSQPGFVCRPVASQAEANAVPTDFTGNMLVMTDLSHGAIYTKVLDPASGSSVFDIYKKVTGEQAPGEAAPTPAPAVDYTPMFAAITDRLDQVGDRVEDLFDRIESQKKAAMRAERKAAVE